MEGAVDDFSAATSHAVVMDERGDAATIFVHDDDDTANAVVQDAVSTHGGATVSTSEILQENTIGNSNHLVTAPAEWSSHRLVSNSSTANREAHHYPYSGEHTQASSNASSSNENSVKNNGVCSCTSRWKAVAVTAAFLVLVTGIAIGLVFGRRDKANTPNTTGLPPDIIVSREAILRVRTYLLQETNWSDPLSLMDPISPQTKAIRQLALEGGQTPVQQQRYGLLVVWYGLGGDDNASGLLNSLQECDWSLVACNEEKTSHVATLFETRIGWNHFGRSGSLEQFR